MIQNINDIEIAIHEYLDLRFEEENLFNEGSPGQALKRLLGLRTFGSPAAQTLASHTSFAGM